jgi:3',5'-cyclic AMP phosphodiesterase CpdA
VLSAICNPKGCPIKPIKPMRILHYSDPHIPTPLHRVPLFKCLGKRAIGGTNLFLGRNRLFADAVVKLDALARFKSEQQVDMVLCTGDYTALGLNHEYMKVVKTTQPLMDAPFGYVHVPGNHDYYASDAIREERFRTYFGDTLKSDLPEYQVDGPWPLVKLISDKLAVIAVNSSRPNPLPWRSSGRISEKQLEKLKTLSNDSRLADRLVLIMTHYAPLLADGSHDSRLHGLTNTEPFLAVPNFAGQLFSAGTCTGVIISLLLKQASPSSVPVVQQWIRKRASGSLISCRKK